MKTPTRFTALLLASCAALGTTSAQDSQPEPEPWRRLAVLEHAEGVWQVGFSPSGDVVTIARRTNSGDEVGTADDFVALSSTCPHLGCKVHWEPQNQRFFCPCHNGIFQPDGKATGGPPAEAGQSLLSYPLNVENGLLYIEVAAESLVARVGVIPEPEGPPGPGHDPCLFARVDDGPSEHLG